MKRNGQRCRFWIALAVFGGSRSGLSGDLFSDPYDLPASLRAPSLPELTHRDTEATAETTVGTLVPSPSPNGEPAGNSIAYAQRFNLEVPLGWRRFFVGSNYEFAVGEPATSSAGAQFVPGNLEVYGRAVWANDTGAAFGAGLGVMAPTAVYSSSENISEAAQSVAALRPWDYAFFQPTGFALRPFVDVRGVEGNFVIQFRQGLDWIVNVTNTNQSTIAAVSTLYMGYRLSSSVGVGVEAFDYYIMQDTVGVTRSINVLVSPSVRFITRYVQPSVSFYTNLSPLAEQSVAQVWGVRVAVTFVWNSMAQTPPQKAVAGIKHYIGRAQPH